MACVVQNHNAAMFGNVLVDYASPDMFLRVTRDRGQFFFAVGTSSRTALAESALLRLLGAEQDLSSLVAQEWSSLTQLASIAEQHLPRILDVLRTPAAQKLVQEKLAHEEKVRALTQNR